MISAMSIWGLVHEVVMVVMSYKLTSIFQRRYDRSHRIYQLAFFESKSRTKNSVVLLLKMSDTGTDKISVGALPC